MTAPLQGTKAERFEQFHHDNPLVYATLERLTQEWVDRFGVTPLGIRMLWERARWELMLATTSADYTLNNNWTPYYVRLLIWHHPEWADLFELRRSPADQWVAERTAALNPQGRNR